jgi:branched-chain amino acid transport system substrate-binding protein
VVHYVYDTYALANGPGKAVTKQGKDSWFFLTADYAFGHSLEKDTSDAVKATGGKVLGAVRHPLNASDFSSFLLQAQASKAKVVGLANAGGDTINSIKAANEFGLTKNQTVVGLLTTIVDIHALGLPTTQGMMFTEGFYWNLNKETREFSRRFFSKHKGMPNMLPAGTYSAVLHYLKAVQAAGTDDTAAVMKKMKETPVNDAFAKGGKIREDGRMIHDMYLVEVKKPGESTEPWDYYHVKQVIPAAEAFQSMALSRCAAVAKK